MIRHTENQVLAQKVAIVQDCIPRYRWAFFEALYSMGLQENISYVVYTSDPIEGNVD